MAGLYSGNNLPDLNLTPHALHSVFGPNVDKMSAKEGPIIDVLVSEKAFRPIVDAEAKVYKTVNSMMQFYQEISL